MYFENISQLLGIPMGLLAALCHVESNHNPNAVRASDGRDGKASYGICQIKYATAKEVKPNVKASELFDPQTNIEVAGLYLKKKYDKYKSWDLALAAYNAGSVKYLKNSKKLANGSYVKKVHKRWKMIKNMMWEQELAKYRAHQDPIAICLMSTSSKQKQQKTISIIPCDRVLRGTAAGN
jgi:soluble lytic murein transglycosylase-like protein